MKEKLNIHGVKKQIGKTLIITAASFTAITGIIATTRESNKQEKNVEKFVNEDNIKPIENISNEQEVETLETPDDILVDMKERYIQEYNENNNTNITLENLKLIKSAQNYILKTEDGRYITHGDVPDVILNALEQEGISYETISDVELYKSIYGDKILEQMLLDGTPVLDGNDVTCLEKNVQSNTLSKFCNIFKKGLAYRENMGKQQLDNYVNSLIEFYDREELNTEKEIVPEDDYEIGD